MKVRILPDPRVLGRPTKNNPPCDHDVTITGSYGNAFRERIFKESKENPRSRSARRYTNTERPMQCTKNTVVEIDGKFYCRLHGGYKALDYLVSLPNKEHD